MRVAALGLLLTASLVRADWPEGPCDISGDVCWDIMNATTCFASIGMGANAAAAPQDLVMRCVNDQDAKAAQNAICKCWGCDSALAIWVKAHPETCPAIKNRGLPFKA